MPASRKITRTRMKFSPIKFLLLSILCTNTTLASFVRKLKQKVHMENVLEKVEGTLTSCHLKCNLNERCVAYGTKRNILMGEVDDCFLITDDGRNKYLAKDHGETIELYVMEMVSKILPISIFTI